MCVIGNCPKWFEMMCEWAIDFKTILILNIISTECWKSATRCTEDIWCRPIELIDSNASRAGSATKFDDRGRWGLYILFFIFAVDQHMNCMHYASSRLNYTQLLVKREHFRSGISNFTPRTQIAFLFLHSWSIFVSPADNHTHKFFLDEECCYSQTTTWVKENTQIHIFSHFTRL